MNYRNARAEEREDFMDLARLSFGFDLEKLIPKVYDIDEDPSPYHKIAIDERGRIRAQIAVLPQLVSVAGRVLKTGFLGIVSTHPRDRGQGHMKALMNLWINEGQERFDWMVLYGQRQRYEHYGFTSGGIRVKHLIEMANLRHALGEVTVEGLSYSAFQASPENHRFALALNEKRLVFVHRNEAHGAKVLTGFGQKAWIILEHGRPIGYLTTSHDGAEITELALSDPDDLKRVLKSYFHFSEKTSLTVLMPESELVLNRSLACFAERTWVEPADMYFIVDFARIIEAYLAVTLASRCLTPGVFSAVMAGQPVTATVGPAGVSVVRKAEPGAIELDRHQAQALILSKYGQPDGVEAPAGWFPLPVCWYFADRF